MSSPWACCSAALGRALAEPGRPVVAVLGDGSSLLRLQGLWSAARRNAPGPVREHGERRLPHCPGDLKGTELGQLGCAQAAASSASTRSAGTAPATCRNWSRAQADEPFGTGWVIPSGADRCRRITVRTNRCSGAIRLVSKQVDPRTSPMSSPDITADSGSSGSSSRGSIPLGEHLEEQFDAVPAGLHRTGC